MSASAIGTMALLLLAALAFALGVGSAVRGIDANNRIVWKMMGPAVLLIWWGMLWAVLGVAIAS